MNKLKLSIIVVASALMLSACNSSSSPTEFVGSARGIWQSGCQNFGIESEYGQVRLNVAETTFEFTNTFYQDPQCSSPTIQFVSSGELSKHDELTGDRLLFTAQIDFEVDQVSAELLSTIKQTQFNNSGTCGLIDWQVNTNVDVSNCVDILDSNVPRTEFDIYSRSTMANSSGVSTDVLFTGMLRGATAESRPSEPDYQNPYWRIDDAATE